MELIVEMISFLLDYYHRILPSIPILLYNEWMNLLFIYYFFFIIIEPLIRKYRIRKDRPLKHHPPNFIQDTKRKKWSEYFYGFLPPQHVLEIFSNALFSKFIGFFIHGIFYTLTYYSFIPINSTNPELYNMMNQSPIPYLSAFQFKVFTELLIFVLAFDLYFYLIHRYVFHSSLGWWFHKVHHQQYQNLLINGFDFHWFESIPTLIFERLFFTLTGFESETRLLAFSLLYWNTLWTHFGYEIVPKWWYSFSITKWLISPLHRIQIFLILDEVHHQKVHYNYGGFTTVYDHLFNTMYPGFEKMNEQFHRENIK